MIVIQNRFYTSLCFILFSVLAFGQQHIIDSLNAEFKKADNDTTKIKVCISLIWKWRSVNTDTAWRYSKTAMELARKRGENLWLGRAYSGEALVYSSDSNYDKAIESFSTAAQLLSSTGKKQEEANCYVNLGWAYSVKNNYLAALENDLKALKLLEELGDDKGRAIVLGNIGIVHCHNKNLDKAIKYTEEAVAIDSRLKNTVSVGRHLGNLGKFYTDQGDLLAKSGNKAEADVKYKLALEKLQEALKISQETDNKQGMALQIGNMATVYWSMGDTVKTVENYTKALAIDSAAGNKEGVSRNLGNMAWTYMAQKKYKLAESCLKRALALGYELKNIALLSTWHADLTELYEQMKQYDSALAHHKASIFFRDSLYNIDNAKKTLEAEMNFEFQKKESVAKEENARQALIKNVFIGGFVVMLVMALLILRSYRIKRKANLAISEQKELLEIKNKEITDSIHYAKRIQKAHLPNDEYISRKLGELKKKV